MRFGTSRRPAPYFDPHDQWRMLRLVGLLALVLIAMNVAADPDTWRWLLPQGTDDNPAPSMDQVDFGVQLGDSDELRPGEFRSAPEPEQSPNTDHQSPDTRPPECRDVRLDPELLSPVRDNTLGVRRAEAGAFYAALAQARDLPARCLEQAARGDVAFTALMVDSERFRGVPITVTGQVRRLTRIETSPNAFGVDAFYEAWLFNSDSGNNPYRIVTAGVPDAMPLGDASDELRVRVTGYFLKREGYASEGGLHTAPLLIGKTLERLPPRAAGIPPAANLPLARYLVVIAAALAVLLGITVWQFGRSDRRFKRAHLDRLATSPGDDSTRLSELNSTDPDEYLRQIAAAEQSTDADRPAGT
jgi:hypothetical protein